MGQVGFDGRQVALQQSQMNPTAGMQMGGMGGQGGQYYGGDPGNTSESFGQRPLLSALATCSGAECLISSLCVSTLMLMALSFNRIRGLQKHVRRPEEPLMHA
eukprot:gnl/TRDRNA2_/TRDRNA2_93096_c1_seq1.p1 gnl/TRDRNA2_/TRDRNA2_93096_c1~~gnl/TRDRNA2_/TRDRNA2_93096_c1_seq1.p1  ORF type:complete len:103 (+),score=10.56 gnl/TRDRNA2_/TRDRNA2_93096_c1_seq1:2-310(+)